MILDELFRIYVGTDGRLDMDSFDRCEWHSHALTERCGHSELVEDYPPRRGTRPGLASRGGPRRGRGGRELEECCDKEAG